MVSKVRPFESNNVIAMLPGADAKLKAEAVMYTAHYDHLGIRPDMPGDNIYNGADDNATGCGILLEMAHAYATAAQRPRRSILFASVTAEEQGLLGSEYLGKHPPIPAGKIALDLNYDDIPPLGSPEEVEVSGSERTTFYPMVQALAQEFRLAIRPDSHPEAGHYYRSDHFSLARVGIPAFSINEGVKYKGHDAAWGLQQANEYTEKHYHQPSDEYHPGIGLHRRCRDGPLRLRPGLGGSQRAQSRRLGEGRRVRAGKAEVRYELKRFNASMWSNVLVRSRASRPRSE